MDHTQPRRLARRTVVKLIAAAAASPPLLAACATAPGAASLPDSAGRAAVRHGPAGTPTDPDLIHPVVPWELTLDTGQRHTLAVLCELIVPGNGRVGAALLGAHDFIDEWVSAPYEAMQQDGALIREGLAWLDAEAGRRFRAVFSALPVERKTAICDAICALRDAAPQLQRPALFFDRVRELTVIAVYTTREGMAELGYVGNVPLTEWPAPPLEVLRHVGLQ